jgi:uncharacterized protein
LKLVIDTNCFLSIVGKSSPYRKLFDGYLKEKSILCVSSEILLEYEEKFNEFWGEEVTNNLLGVILTASNTQFQTVYYNFNLISTDQDDNKFSDAYLAASADFLITQDKALLALIKNDFPLVNAVTLQDFFDFHFAHS